MADSTMAQAKRDFELGYLDGFDLVRNPLNSGWSVWLCPKISGVGGWLVDARSKETRVFKTLDAAVSGVESIGFEVDRLYRDGGKRPK